MVEIRQGTLGPGARSPAGNTGLQPVRFKERTECIDSGWPRLLKAAGFTPERLHHEKGLAILADFGSNIEPPW